MARPRQFDEHVALEVAMNRFWERGYERTTVRDLSDKMGVTLSSFFNAFGDKRSVFERALQLYVLEVVGSLTAHFDEDAPPLTILERFFADLIGKSLEDPDNRGCLVANSVVEIGPHDAGFREVVVQVMARFEKSFEKLIRRGQREGTVNASLSPKEMASLLLALMVSLRVLVRARPERALLEGAIRPVFVLLAPATSGAMSPSKLRRKTSSPD
ncbi:TetR/AcrR family transcriptional regulator [uncultured Nevskia sp.]|uniref:TetR/AcrR family transcriptional regulator n=1 Tax=uncultured Nevskia sp. TaxID=228950 RepID=UPI0025F84218|nr:TetR/AcrR family transcriptional regulator [uncultured Nevskia sp.]